MRTVLVLDIIRPTTKRRICVEQLFARLWRSTSNRMWMTVSKEVTLKNCIEWRITGIQGTFPPNTEGLHQKSTIVFIRLILWTKWRGRRAILGQLAINSMALPPIIDYGTQYVKDLVVHGVVSGDLNIGLQLVSPPLGPT